MDSLNAAANAASCRADWTWSLRLIVLTVVIHVFGLTSAFLFSMIQEVWLPGPREAASALI